MRPIPDPWGMGNYQDHTRPASNEFFPDDERIFTPLDPMILLHVFALPISYLRSCPPLSHAYPHPTTSPTHRPPGLCFDANRDPCSRSPTGVLETEVFGARIRGELHGLSFPEEPLFFYIL